jgi:hypothetical protein
MRLSAAGYGSGYASARFPRPVSNLCRSAIRDEGTLSLVCYSDLLKQADIFHTQ